LRKKTKEDGLLRLSRMSGQVTGLAKMVMDERYCVDILTQVAALRAALDSFAALLLTAHIEDCIRGDGVQTECTESDRVEDVRLALSRFLK